MNSVDQQERFRQVRDRVAAAARSAGRDPVSVTVVAVTKGHPPSMLRAVVEAGFEHVGENRVGAAADKRRELPELPATWHLIGHLQRNKAAQAIETFDRVDSVDSLRLARRLSSLVGRDGRPDLGVLVQVNASGEPSKHGLEPGAVVRTVAEVVDLPGLRVDGLMTMAPYGAGEVELARVFAATRECLADCHAALPGRVGCELSMGMSDDFEIAILEGATQVRLGTALLGERPGFG